MVRLFVGIRIENQPKLVELSSNLREILADSNINWVEPESFHLTLKFLGDVESFYINSINMLLSHLSSKHQPFNLHFNKLGFFGNILQPRVIWFNFRPSGELNLLQQSVDHTLNELGFEIENHAYKPHLTLGRVKRMKDNNEFSQMVNSQPEYTGSIKIQRFQLIESVLKPSGPVYTTITEFNFKSELIT
jgi:RNA 2',3'-cyclic 3'-phosphodiesterase